jgi:cystathionine beta-lyase
MNGYTGMLSFELLPEIDANSFMKSLKLIKQSMSLAGVETTILSPAKTSHALLTAVEREHQGISDGLLRFSVGIEESKDLIEDFKQAFKAIDKKQFA